MKTNLYHLQLNVSPQSLVFYKDLFGYLGYKIIDESSEHIGVSNGTTDFWLIQTEQKYLSNNFHRKNLGINHLAFGVESKDAVDQFTNEFLKTRSVPILYDTPKLFPEYSPNYYAVYFEDPDRLKLEVVFKG